MLEIVDHLSAASTALVAQLGECELVKAVSQFVSRGCLPLDYRCAANAEFDADCFLSVVCLFVVCARDPQVIAWLSSLLDEEQHWFTPVCQVALSAVLAVPLLVAARDHADRLD